MADQPSKFHLLTPSTLPTTGQASLGPMIGSLGNSASATWPTADKALFIPFRVAQPLDVVQFFLFNGATVSGNFDVGIYDIAGTKIVSKGSTAQSGANALQIADTTNVRIGPGLFYLAIVFNNTTATIRRFAPAALTTDMCKMIGMAQMDSAFPLPDTATFATVSQAFIPYFAISLTGFS